MVGIGIDYKDRNGYIVVILLKVVTSDDDSDNGGDNDRICGSSRVNCCGRYYSRVK